MEILIDKTEVYDYAMALTARAGTALDSYNTIAITRDNYPMLDIYLSEAVVNVETALRKKLSSSHDVNLLVEGNTIQLSCKDNLSVEPSVYNLISSSIRLYLAYYIACSWLLLSPAVSTADVYRSTAQSHLDAALMSFEQKKTLSLSEEDYQNRKKDNVLARPGRIIGDEVLLVKVDEDGEQMEPAVTFRGEHLMYDK